MLTMRMATTSYKTVVMNKKQASHRTTCNRKTQTTTEETVQLRKATVGDKKVIKKIYFLFKRRQAEEQR